MKLYMHPVSTAWRPVRLFIADNKIKWKWRSSTS